MRNQVYTFEAKLLRRQHLWNSKEKGTLFKNVSAQTYGADMSTTPLNLLLDIFVIFDYYVTLGIHPCC